ncbi:NAD-dependent protein deacylase [Breznakia pachnodae]|uniref:NAD-dependent protein deacetylase n=1 Tax=Breznakia pachnodae TaxID=265178 RepID=A0ABU0E3Q0_9FIRM|nr:NAD-dependent protein deacylase [Breznakia pachnodae]MDQ0361369.1 NAD-dependent deacetylase [Breznakia pachnodae]
MKTQPIEQLNEIIKNSNNIVFFGGAGVSTESGIPDFRSKDGLYNQKYAYPPETIISRTFFDEFSEEFFRFYKDRVICLTALPNPAHIKLAELEKTGKLKAVITQNIDGLHQLAGSNNVIELHGSIHRNYCMKCHTFYDAEFIANSDGVPHCTVCDGIVKPDVVLYEESLNINDLNKAIEYIQQADTLIVGGTSLVVYPAAGLVDNFNGKHLIEINKTPTKETHQADLVINQPIGEVFSKIDI